jgi:hypothetical protein
MRTLVFVLLCVLTFTSPQFSQTQLLRAGNAIQYSDEGNYEWIIVTTKMVTIDGEEYFERKFYSPWYTQSVFIKSLERIDGDSTYFVLNANNQDSLIFNFNWRAGKKYFTSTNGNIFSGQRIDSIKITNTFLIDDTVYVLKNFTYNTTTGDTSFNVFPEYNHITKKIGRLDEGIWVYATGIKVNGARYGNVHPYPEEIFFSEDSLCIPTLSDSGSTKIVNSSDYPVRIDSIISVGSFYGYWGNFSKPGFEYPFYLFQTMPGFMGDTLGIVIPPHDSINVSFFNVDLCPICDYEVQEYFKDTLRLVFTFMDGNVYSFSKSIPISGEGHPSDVEEEEILPKEFSLEQNYPNPFNPGTIIQYAIGSRQYVTLKVYDVLGNEVATLVNEYKAAGSYKVEFNVGRDSSPALASGIYFYQLKAGDPSTSSGQGFVETKKTIYLK